MVKATLLESKDARRWWRRKRGRAEGQIRLPLLHPGTPSPSAPAFKMKSAPWLRACLLLILLLSLSSPADAQSTSGSGSSTTANFGTSTLGCQCVEECGRTIDKWDEAWCPTSEVNPPANYTGCGYWSPQLDLFWDTCVPVINGTSGDSVLLKTFPAMWTSITVSAVGTAASCFFLMGLVASGCISPGKTLVWLPFITALIGSCHALFVSAIFATILSFLYLSMPYAIDLSDGISFGVVLALLLVYASLGRQHAKMRPPHPSEFET